MSNFMLATTSNLYRDYTFARDDVRMYTTEFYEASGEASSLRRKGMALGDMNMISRADTIAENQSFTLANKVSAEERHEEIVRTAEAIMNLVASAGRL